jgi:cyclophilin family peptidyl-prolyl cis-trans isomerase
MKYNPWRPIILTLFAVTAGSALAASSAPRVRVTTSMGQFVIELSPERAPLTVANFLRYVHEGHYTDTLVHRVVGNFVIQGGGHAAGSLELKPNHDPVVNESGNGLMNKRGTVGLARSDAPHSGNSQFYININDNPDLDPVATRWGYAVFGKVVEGMDVVDRIGAVPTASMGPFKSDAPIKPIIIQKIEEVDANAAAPAAAAPAASTGPTAPAASPAAGAPAAAPNPPPH